MVDIQFDASLDRPPGYRADAVWEGHVFKVLVNQRDTRKVRTAFMELAGAANAEWVKRIILVLEKPTITTSRLQEEWRGAARVFKPDLFARLSIVIHSDAGWDGLPEPPDTRLIAVLKRVLEHENRRHAERPRRGSQAVHEILQILVHRWMLGEGPATVKWLMSTSGLSYPTVAKATEQLDYYVKRHSGGSVELTRFPREAWDRLMVMSDTVRATVRYADRSGQPRSPASLLKRLRALGRDDIAVGGTWGARHHFPGLDLVGDPRVDLSLHAPRHKPDHSFVHRLDPALAPISDRGEPAALVVHVVRRQESFFAPSPEGPPWADPVECLLDLQEMRLGSQASEFLEAFAARKAGA
jgi:hypothetical protein